MTQIVRPLWWGDPAAAGILRSWHAGVTERRAARAALRRFGPAEDACLVPEYGELVLRLREAGFPLSTSRAMRMTAEAVAVAEIDDDGPAFEEREEPRPSASVFAEPFAKAVVGGEIAPARSRLLLSTDDPLLFLRLLRGTLSMLRAKRKPAPVVAVAEIVRRWRNSEQRAVMRRHLALALAGHLAAEQKEAP